MIDETKLNAMPLDQLLNVTVRLADTSAELRAANERKNVLLLQLTQAIAHKAVERLFAWIKDTFPKAQDTHEWDLLYFNSQQRMERYYDNFMASRRLAKNAVAWWRIARYPSDTRALWIVLEASGQLKVQRMFSEERAPLPTTAQDVSDLLFDRKPLTPTKETSHV